MPAIKRRESLAALQGLPSVSLSPLYDESHATERTLSISALVEQCRQEIGAFRRGETSNEAYGLELLRRAIVQGDQDAWRGLAQSFDETVRGWLHGHPRREAARRLESEETYVALTFERFWQATTQQQVVFKTLGGALAYLRASLNGAILDTLRTYSRPREVALPEPGDAGEPQVEDQADSNEIWEVLQDMLHIRRLATLPEIIEQLG